MRPQLLLLCRLYLLPYCNRLSSMSEPRWLRKTCTYCSLMQSELVYTFVYISCAAYVDHQNLTSSVYEKFSFF